MKLAIVNTPIFGVVLTLVCFWLAREIYLRLPWSLLNPLLLAPALIVLILLSAGLPYESYQPGSKLVTFFIGPATVALAVPLYKQLPILKKYFTQIMVSIALGSVTGVVSVVVLAKVLGASSKTALSLAAKSTTAPIAIGITQELGGSTALVIFGVVITGILGGIIGPEFLKLMGVKDRIAIGIGIGAASHVGGTSRAVQLGEIEGSMSGVAIALMGIATAIVAPWLLKFFIG